MAEHSRREFIRLATVAAAAFAAGCSGDDELAADAETARGPCVPPPDGEWLVPSNPEVGLPHLGGAPDSPEGWTVAAFVDTVIPGAHRDPTGAPGALDVGAPALFYDPELPAAEFIPQLAGFLDLVAAAIAPGKIFGTLSPAQRDQALEEAMEIELMEFAVQLARLAYYASGPAGCHLGYPGANPGYVDDPEVSFAEVLATEVTEDGNYP